MIMYNLKEKNKWGVCTVIRQMLLADETIKSLVGNKIYPIVAPEKTQGNYIVYQRDEYSIDRTKMGIATQKCVVYISCVSSSYDTAQEMAVAVFNLLDGEYNINEKQCSIKQIHMTDSTEDYEGDCYIETLQFEIL